MKPLRSLLVVSVVMGLAACASSSQKSDDSETLLHRLPPGAVIVTSGGMDKEAIRQTIRDHLKDIRACYETELKDDPSLSGKIVLEWDVEERGKVTRIQTLKTFNQHVSNCIAGHLRKWKFPEPPKNQIGRISYPFVFSSGDDEKDKKFK